MNLVQALDFFEKKLRLLSKTQKLQLYLIPFFIALFIVYNFVDLKHPKQPNVVETLEKKQTNGYLFLKHFQDFIQQRAISLDNIKQNGLRFSVQVEGEFLDLMQLILFCELFESVNSIMDFKLDFNENQPTLWLEFELETYQYEAHQPYDKLLDFIRTLQNPFQNQIVLSHEIPQININAIVNNEVLLNDVWLKVGSSFLDYTLLEIHQRFIVLQKNNGERLVIDLIRK